MRLKWILLLTVVLTSVAEAGPRRSSRVYSAPQFVTMPAMPAVATPNRVVMSPTPMVTHSGVVQSSVVMPANPVGPTTGVVQSAFVTSPATSAPTIVPASGFGTPAPAMTTGGGLAQQKAEIQARAGRCFHPGGSLGAGTHEGCGFSTVSADDAIRHCCYWGQRSPIDIGVARGGNGWYATVIYR